MKNEINLDGLSTEASSNYQNLDQKSTRELLEGINQEDATVAAAVKKVIPEIEILVDQIVLRMHKGGRIFYIGAGTSGRIGVVDASECPPTFGVPHGMVVGIMAGGDKAIRKAVENAEDDEDQAWEDLKEFNINENDTVIGIAASGRTPYVIGGLKAANTNGILTGCVVCNADSPVANNAKFPITVVVGPEFVTGSTRMKSGTAQKLVLNMISTSVMIKLGRVKGNKMVDMQLSNEKLIERGTRMVMAELNIEHDIALDLLTKFGSVRNAVDNYKK
jgi:N-acetylmuramic acid 6-phosphate etherase